MTLIKTPYSMVMVVVVVVVPDSLGFLFRSVSPPATQVQGRPYCEEKKNKHVPC